MKILSIEHIVFEKKKIPHTATMPGYDFCILGMLLTVELGCRKLDLEFQNGEAFYHDDENAPRQDVFSLLEINESYTGAETRESYRRRKTTQARDERLCKLLVALNAAEQTLEALQSEYPEYNIEELEKLPQLIERKIHERYTSIESELEELEYGEQHHVD